MLPLLGGRSWSIVDARAPAGEMLRTPVAEQVEHLAEVALLASRGQRSRPCLAVHLGQAASVERSVIVQAQGAQALLDLASRHVGRGERRTRRAARRSDVEHIDGMVTPASDEKEIGLDRLVLHTVQQGVIDTWGRFGGVRAQW